MRTWLGSLLLVVMGSFAVASGCGSPDVVNGGMGPSAGNSNTGGDSGTGNNDGNGATSGGLIIGPGEGGDRNDGCPSTCDQLNANCGTVTDTRCTSVIECGKCKDGEFCGGDGPSRCGTGTGEGGACNGTDCMSCMPKTCADLGYTCGPAGDTCGGKLDCGSSTCAIPGWTCGGGNKLGVCGCTGACSQVPDCTTAPIKTTTLTGKVYDPAGNNPLYHVFVYVANNPADPDLATFPKGITCDVCGATAAGSPVLGADGMAGTYTDETGTFNLTNVPVGKGLTVVIQLGRWRRVFTLDIDTPCGVNAVPDKTLLMPSKQSQGNIPLMAMVTGNADSLECVLRKMGIADTEFTDPAAGGRVQFYLGNDQTGKGGNYGQKIGPNTPPQSALFAMDATNQPVINGYDMTILACQGSAYTQSAADQTTLRNYAASGGRVFSSHYSYTWSNHNDTDVTPAGAGKADNWSEVAKWNDDGRDEPATAVGIIDLVSNPKGNAFKGWLKAVGASPGMAGTDGTTDVIVIRHDTDKISSVAGQTQQWLYRAGDNAKQCAIDNKITCNNTADCGLPKYCSAKTTSACTADGDCSKYCKNLMTFTTCTQNSQCGGNNNCVAQTCKTNACNGTDYTGTTTPLHFTWNTPVNLTEDLTTTPPKLQCGRVLFSDFHVQDAQEHDKVFPAQCDTKPMNSQEKLLEFMIFDLGSCVPPAKQCVPATTCPAGEDCGFAPDGCGGLVSCGVCPTGESCGVGNPPVANKCGKGMQTCVPTTCAAQKLACGPAADGCGAKIDSCGMCAAGELCVMGMCEHVN